MKESSPLSQKAVRLRVFGRVQGVGFRYWTCRLAQRLGVTGWVRNERDGSVSVEAEGPEDTVDRLVKSVRQGPPGARVDRVEITSLTPKGVYRDFTVEF
ncbi:MAG: acylphosphatase [Spirochaetales bacterium]